MPNRVYYYLHQHHTPDTPVNSLTFRRRAPKAIDGKRPIYLRVDLEAHGDCDVEPNLYGNARARTYLTNDGRRLGDFPYDVYIPRGPNGTVDNELKVLTHDELTMLCHDYPVATLAALPIELRRELIQRTHDALDHGPWLERLDHLTSAEITEHLSRLQREYQHRFPGVAKRLS